MPHLKKVQFTAEDVNESHLLIRTDILQVYFKFFHRIIKTALVLDLQGIIKIAYVLDLQGLYKIAGGWINKLHKSIHMMAGATEEISIRLLEQS